MRKFFLLLPLLPVALHAQVYPQAGASGQGGTGTVTSVSGLSPLFTTATPSTTPTFALSSASAFFVFGNCTSSSGVPTYCAITPAMIPTLNQNTTGTAANVTGIIGVANGGTGTTTPGLVAGSNVAITGAWPNQTISSTATSGTSTAILTVKQYGAVANGSSTPACTALGLTTLAQLQAYNSGEYSFATSCTNQMDWLATQKAVNSVAAAGTSAAGTIIQLPAGVMIFDQPLILPIGNSVTQTNNPSIHLIGAGQGVTVIEPSIADFGAGSALVSCGLPNASYADNSNAGSGRYTVSGECYENIENLSLFNPYYSGTATGTSTSYGPSGIINVPEPVASSTPIQMDGFVIGGQTHLHRVSAWGFRMGLNVVGDHMTWDQGDFQHNFCGVYFAPENKFNQGDIVMQGHFDVGANSLAGICVDKDAFFNVQQTGELYTGRNPYGIFKFSGTADSYINGSTGYYSSFITNSTFAGLIQSESVNNAAIWDDNMTNPSGGVTSVANGGAVINTRMKLYTSNYAVSPITTGGRGRFDYIGLEVANGFTIENQPNSMLYASGLSAQMHVWSGGYQAGGLVLVEDFDNQLAAYGNANTELVTFLNANDPGKRFVQLVNPGKWSGGCADMYSGTAVTAGTVLGNNDYLTMQPNNGAQAVTGIAMEPFTVPSGGLGYKCVAYANQGSNITVNAAGLNNSTVNTPFVAGATGGGIPSSTSGGYVIGTQVNGILSSTQTSANLTGLGGFMPPPGLRSSSAVQLTTAAQVACSAASAGLLSYVQNNSTTKDTVSVCAHDATNAYAWRTIY